MINIIKNLNITLKRWFQNNFILKQTYYSLFSSNLILSKAYGLPRIHKKDYLFRIIVSSINTALYPLASFLQIIISNSLTQSNNNKLKINLSCMSLYQVQKYVIQTL